MSTVLSAVDAAALVVFSLYVAQQFAAATQPRPTPPEQEHGVGMTFLIPALNEAQVIHATLENLRATVPAARVVVIDDASDDRTAQIVAAFAERDPMVVLLRRTLPEARQNKASAMNWAVQRLLTEGFFQHPEQDVMVVLDADGRIGPEFPRQVRGAFHDPNVMAAQGWMRFRQTGSGPGWFGVVQRMMLFQQDLEAFITGHIQRYRHRGGTASLTGNGQCMRASYVQDQLARGVSPWPHVLLEDFASAVEVRLHAPAHRVAYLTAQVGQQGMVELPGFIRQRVRWTQGAMECLSYLPRLWQRPGSVVTRLDFSYFILAPWLNVILLSSIVSQGLRRVFGWEGLALPGAVGALLTVLPLAFQLNWAVRYTLERQLPWTAVPYTLLSLPVYSFVLLLSLPMAYWRHFTGQRGWYKSVRHDDRLPEDGEGPGGVSQEPALRSS
ncbi:glycosyltransferase [Deinococcus taeanensis]|uniref:glycosyltransferase family 2 protein n=1 Tax=Deinococcus taeanensis TaxID=2737050 RepID=UPI001CDBBEA8|nr:glycosyltransferase [Deinococcus taeanensis]UBV41543.1 glycosyltransferase [Deinococcus taeanensis]